MNNDLLARRLKPPSPAPVTPIFAPAHAAQAPQPTVVPAPESIAESLVFAEPTPPALAEVEPVAEVEQLAEVEPVAEVEPLAQTDQLPQFEQPAEIEPVAELEQPAQLEPPAQFEQLVELEPLAQSEPPVAFMAEPFELVWEGMVEPAWDSFDLREVDAPEPAPEAVWEVDESDREDAAPWQPSGEAEAIAAPTAASDTFAPTEFSTDIESSLVAHDTAAEAASPVVPEEHDPRLSIFAVPEADDPEHQPEETVPSAEHSNGHAPWSLDTLEAVAVVESVQVTPEEQAPVDEAPFTAEEQARVDEAPWTDEASDVEAPAAVTTLEAAPLLNEPLVDPQIFEAPPPQDEPRDDLLFGSWRSEPRGASVFGDIFAAPQPQVELEAQAAFDLEAAADPVEWPPVPIDAFPLHDRPVPNGELELPGELAILWPGTPSAQTFWPDLPVESATPLVLTIAATSVEHEVPSPIEAPVDEPLVVEPRAVEPQPATAPAFIAPPSLMADLPEPPPDPFGHAGYAPAPSSLIFADLPPTSAAAATLPQADQATNDGAFARFTNQASAFAERIPDHWSLMSQPLTPAGEEVAVHEPWHVQASALTVVMAIAVIGLVLTFIYLFTPLMR